MVQIIPIIRMIYFFSFSFRKIKNLPERQDRNLRPLSLMVGKASHFFCYVLKLRFRFTAPSFFPRFSSKDIIFHPVMKVIDDGLPVEILPNHYAAFVFRSIPPVISNKDRSRNTSFFCPIRILYYGHCSHIKQCSCS